jgi:hypothetical protein
MFLVLQGSFKCVEFLEEEVGPLLVTGICCGVGFGACQRAR